MAPPVEKRLADNCGVEDSRGILYTHCYPGGLSLGGGAKNRQEKEGDKQKLFHKFFLFFGFEFDCRKELFSREKAAFTPPYSFFSYIIN